MYRPARVGSLPASSVERTDGESEISVWEIEARRSSGLAPLKSRNEVTFPKPVSKTEAKMLLLNERLLELTAKLSLVVLSVEVSSSRPRRSLCLFNGNSSARLAWFERRRAGRESFRTWDLLLYEAWKNSRSWESPDSSTPKPPGFKHKPLSTDAAFLSIDADSFAFNRRIR